MMNANNAYFENLKKIGHDWESDELKAQPEEIELTVSLPISNHTGNTLRNMVNLIYTRGGMNNKALGTGFVAEQGLVEALAKREDLLTTEDFRGAVAAYEREHGPSLSGITLTADTITFSTLLETADPDVIRAFTELVAMMNKQALSTERSPI